MTLTTLIHELNDFLAAHPEAGDAPIWAEDREAGRTFRLEYLGYDKRHKPYRVKLESA